MRHLTEEITDLAPRGSRLSAVIRHLDMFGVVGILSPHDIRTAIDWVKQHVPGVRFSENRGLIWMPTVGEPLDRQFSGLRQRGSALEKTRQPLLGWPGGSSDIKDI